MKPLHRLLIANRGEIVVRVARTARRLGMATVAVCSDADRANPHAQACDETIPLGGDAAADSYLRIDKLIDAARKARADAIHPGYGFLAESAEFAEAVEQAGLVFVGPPPSAIAAMGDKARARRRMAASGIPVVPGYDGDSQAPADFAAAADAIGFPIMVKAAAGGGGRGMRYVATSSELPGALNSAASEAAKAFGDGRLILERAITEPRHVEIQVIADAHGHVVHLGERDCTVQRRHQKVIEEAPSPAVNAELRERMGATAIAVARAIGYVGAGTVEFLLDRDGQYYFMEMNTRLQVEHPVTECVTGLDLVELQLLIARGETLAFTQRDVQWRGHAMEVRLCAEAPGDDFMPASGAVLDWSAPRHVRCDHALARGATVPTWYDSMVAKVVAHGTTREECLDELADALDHTVLLGVQTNRAFAARVLRHPVFRASNDVSTAFIARQFPDAATRTSVPDDRAWALGAWLSVAASVEAHAIPAAWRYWSTGRALPHPWRLQWHAPTASADQASAERRGRVHVARDRSVVEVAEQHWTVEGPPAAPLTDARATVDGQSIEYRYTWHGRTLWLHLCDGDYAFTCRRRDAAMATGNTGAAAREVLATINARVVDVPATAGAEVRPGDRLVVLEAMKMEHEVRAMRAGRIAEVAVHVGLQVAPGQLLVRYEGEA